MKKGRAGSGKATRQADLRARAERLLREAPEKKKIMPAEDVEVLFHELQVRQAELEIQNEELRRAQRDLEESRNRYFKLYDLAPVGYFTLKRNALILQTNLAGAELLGREKARLKGKLFTQFVQRDDQNIFLSHLDSLVENKMPQTCELRLMGTDEKPVYVRMESIPARNGVEDVVSIRSAVVDVTEQKKALLALRESEERFRLIAETCPDIIFQIDPRGTVIYCSSSIERVLGYTPAEVAGTPFEKYVPPPEFPAARNNFQHLIREEEIRSFDLHILSKSRMVVPFEINASSLFRAGEVETIFAILRDITKRKRFEEALRSSGQKILDESERRHFLSRKLVETVEQDRRDVAMYLHDEIGQMLATLKMDIEMLEDDASKHEALLKEKLEQIREKVLTVMGNVRDISRKLSPDILDTLGLIPSLRSLIRCFKEEDGLPIDFFHGEIPERFDAGKALAIYRIIQEALNNVSKHAKATEVFVNLVVKGVSILVSVEDNGTGFDYKKMMEKASAEDSMGIMIMKERAVHAGGELGVESKIGKGTQVMLEMPIG